MDFIIKMDFETQWMASRLKSEPFSQILSGKNISQKPSL